MFSMWYFAKWIIDALVAKDYNQMTFWIFCLLFANLIRSWMSIYFSRTWQNLTNKMTRDIQSKYLNKYFNADNNIAEQIGSSRIQSIIKMWANWWIQIIGLFTNTWMDFIINFILWWIILFYYSWKLWLLISWILLLVIILWKRSEKLSSTNRKEHKEKTTELDRQLAKSIGSKFEILLQGQNNKEVSIIMGLWDKIRWNINNIWKYRLMYNRLPSFIMDMTEVVIYYYLWTQVISWTIWIWDLTFIIMILGRSKDYFRMFGDMNQQYSDNILHYTKLHETFQTLVEIPNYLIWKQFIYKEGKILFDSLSYKYPGWSEVFINFNLSIQWNTKVAFVGSSWSGKSTLIKLISWYIHPNEWNIVVDGQKLSDISLKSYYHHIGYLTQEPSVFDGSIKDNLMYAVSDQDISEDRVKEIIALAQCDWIYDLKDWLDTEIGEKWIKLSWGQRQRLAIAKIMLKDPSIILLDEPTSALDSFAEEEVTKAMNNLFEWRTVIIIAHRLQTVKHADEIIVLGNEEGKIGTQILERGNHQELIAKWWFYAKMLELQSGF